MSDASSTHQGKNEIIIVKRRRGGEEGHHGGVWKIAYADFMTAMMAFFLVMWLVNAANEETKESVASYFNPIKLMDEKPADRGIKQVGNSADGEATAAKSEVEGQETTSGQAGEAGEKENATVGEKTDYSEADYFENPYSVLAEIAQETGTQTNISAPRAMVAPRIRAPRAAPRAGKPIGIPSIRTSGPSRSSRSAKHWKKARPWSRPRISSKIPAPRMKPVNRLRVRKRNSPGRWAARVPRSKAPAR